MKMSDALEQNRASYTELKTYTIDEIYGDGWWERNSEELNRRFQWAFRYAVSGDRILAIKMGLRCETSGLVHLTAHPLIVILAEKPQPPTIKSVYGKPLSELTPPEGYEFTEFSTDKRSADAWLGEGGDLFLNRHPNDPLGYPRLLLQKKPKPPTLRDIYGVDEVTIPTGWEWTGEFRGPKYDEVYSSTPGRFTSAETCCGNNPNYHPRLILRKRQPKVWFKAEKKPRLPKKGDWFWSYSNRSWYLAPGDFFLNEVPCATRHEETDTTTQTVTQADIDRLQKVNS